MRRQRTFGRALALALAASLVVGACSSGGDTASSSPGGSDSGGGGGTIAASVDAAKAAAARPTQILVTEPLGAPAAKGKTVHWIQCSIPACTQLGAALKEGTDALGWNLRILDGGITPESIKAAWGVAAREEPDAVIASGFPHAVYQEELNTLLAAGTPVVNIDITDKPLPGEFVVQGEKDFLDGGALSADWVLAQGGQGTNALFVTSSAFPVVGARADGYKGQFDRRCPSCELEVMEASPTEIGSTLPTKIVGALQADPSIGFVTLGVGDMATGLVSALRAAGLNDRVQITLSDINPALQADIKAGSALKATVMMEAVDMMWQSLDVLLRTFAGKPVTADDKPALKWIVSKDNMGDWHEPFPIVADYQAQYKKLWGIG